jgi:hypothetical protein
MENTFRYQPLARYYAHEREDGSRIGALLLKPSCIANASENRIDLSHLDHVEAQLDTHLAKLGAAQTSTSATFAAPFFLSMFSGFTKASNKRPGMTGRGKGA